MKSFIKIAFLLFSLTVFAQSKSTTLENIEWVNKDLDYIRFNNDTLTYNLAGKKYQIEYDIIKSTLLLKERYTIGGTIQKVEEFPLKIKYQSKSKLVIYPLIDQLTLDQEDFKKLDYAPFFKRKEYTFYNRNNMVNRFDYDKITFHGSTCFGTCPSFTVEINRDGTVFYEGRIYTKEFTGNFQGQLSKEERVKLIKILNRSLIAQIDRNWSQTTHVTDQPRYNYIVKLKNGEKVEINTNDQHPILDQLSNYFINIPEKLELTKVKTKHIFEKPSLKGFEIVSREED